MKKQNIELLDCLKTIISKSRYLAKLLINFLSLSGFIELSPIQQALIYSFCENHDKAIQVLDGITLNKPDVPMCTLLAKAQMKAKRNKVKTDNQYSNSKPKSQRLSREALARL